MDREVQRKLFEQRERQKCALKKKYFDEHSALGAAKNYQKIKPGRYGGWESKAYKCRWCGFWHLTKRTYEKVHDNP